MSKLNTSSLKVLKFGHSLQTHDNIHGIINTITEHIRTIPQYDTLYLNCDLIVHICRAIENIVYDSKLKDIDKYELFMSIYGQIYPNPMTDQDKQTIKNIIELSNNNQLFKISKINKMFVVKFFIGVFSIVSNALSISH
jgi:hypothetical protein